MKRFFILLIAALSCFCSYASPAFKEIYLTRKPLTPQLLMPIEEHLQSQWGDFWATHNLTLPDDPQQQLDLIYALLSLSRTSTQYVSLEKLLTATQLCLSYTKQLDNKLLYADALLQRGKVVGLYQEKLDEAKSLTQQALEITTPLYNQANASKLTQQLHQDALSQLGRILSHNTEHQAALPYLEQALKIAEQLDIKSEQITLLNLIGSSYRNIGDIAKQLDFQYKALTIAQDQHSPKLKADALRNIGLTYKHLGQFDKSIDHFNQALTIYQEHNLPRRAAKTLNYLGTTFEEINQPEQAIAVYLEALSIYEEYGYNNGIGLLSFNLSEAYLQINDPHRAERYNQKAIGKFTQINHTRYLTEAYLQGMQLQQQRNNMALATDYALKAVELLPPHDNVKHIRRIREDVQAVLDANGYAHVVRTLLEKELEAIVNEQASPAPQFDVIAAKHEQQRLNNQLSQKNAQLENIQAQSDLYFSWISWSLVTAVSLFLCSIIQTFRLKQQKKETTAIKQTHKLNANTGLENEVDIQLKLHPKLRDIIRNWELWYAGDKEQETPERCQFIMVYCEFMDELYSELGFTKGRETEQRFGTYLQKKFDEQYRIIQLRDNMLFITAPCGVSSEQAKHILHLLHRFTTKHTLAHKPFSLALMDFPFLQRSGRATGEEIVSDILLIALYGARQLSRKFSESAWVKLNAIDATPASFLAQNPRENIMSGIDKGYIKVEASHDKQEISWPSRQV